MGSIILIAIFLLIALFLLREPLQEVVQAHVEEEIAAKQAAEQAAQEAAAYAALERNIRSILDTTDQQFGILSDNLKQLASEFELNLGIPLHLAHKDSTPVIDDAILRSQSFRQNFVRLLNARTPPASVESKRRTLSSVKRHLHDGTLTDLDRTALQTDYDWICSKQEVIQSQQNRLQQIITWIQNKTYPVNPNSMKGD